MTRRLVVQPRYRKESAQAGIVVSVFGTPVPHDRLAEPNQTTRLILVLNVQYNTPMPL